MTEPDSQPLYESVASTPEGVRTLASARLRRDVLAVLNATAAARGLDFDDLAELLGIGKTEVKDVLCGDGDILVGTLAEFLAAMGYEIKMTLQPAGTARSGAHGSFWADLHRRMQDPEFRRAYEEEDQRLKNRQG